MSYGLCGEGYSAVGGVCTARLGGGDAFTNRSPHAPLLRGIRAQLLTTTTTTTTIGESDSAVAQAESC